MRQRSGDKEADEPMISDFIPLLLDGKPIGSRDEIAACDSCNRHLTDGHSEHDPDDAEADTVFVYATPVQATNQWSIRRVYCEACGPPSDGEDEDDGDEAIVEGTVAYAGSHDAFVLSDPEYPNRTRSADDGIFADCVLGYEEIRGKRTFEEVLYSESYVDEHIPDGTFPDNRAGEIKWHVESARRGVEKPDVLVPRGYRILTYNSHRSHTNVVFYDTKVVRGRLLSHQRGPPQYENSGIGLEQLYRTAVESDTYEVELVDVDYESGNVTIRVEEADE